MTVSKENRTEILPLARKLRFVGPPSSSERDKRPNYPFPALLIPAYYLVTEIDLSVRKGLLHYL
jgi:hypothetical protein